MRDSARKAHRSVAAVVPPRAEAPPPLYPPEVVHEARIELAREALTQDNEAKAEAEEDEAMQRDIAVAHADTRVH